MKPYCSPLMSISVAALILFTLAACSTAPQTEQGKDNIETDARQALSKAKASDRTLNDLFNRSAGYAVFPSVGKGAIGVGGAYGKGVLYDHGTAVGYCDLTQGSIGFQLGGQSYTEIIAFETTKALDNFKQGNLQFGAQATAVALKSGAGANAKFTDGVAVFTMDEAGLMFEASIGGQQFTYESKQTTRRY